MNPNNFLDFLSLQVVSLFLNQMIINEKCKFVTLFYDKSLQDSGLFSAINEDPEEYVQWISFNVKTPNVTDLYVQHSSYIQNSLLIYAVQTQNVQEITKLTKNLSNTMVFLFTPNNFNSRNELKKTVIQTMKYWNSYKIIVIMINERNGFEFYIPQSFNGNPIYIYNAESIKTSTFHPENIYRKLIRNYEKGLTINFQMRIKPPKIRYCETKSCNVNFTGAHFFLMNFIATQLKKPHFFSIVDLESNSTMHFAPKGKRAIYNELNPPYKQKKIKYDYFKINLNY